MIPYGKQDINQDDINAVIDVLSSDFITQGPVVPKFEQAIADYCQANYAVAVNSATSALHIACLALDIKQGDVVWTSPISFVASANCALYCGADVDFVDIDANTFNICPKALEQKLKQAKANKRLPKAIIVVHMAGVSCDLQVIAALTKPYEIKIIEDASHAIGAKYQDKPVGNCFYSDISIFSFHPVKIITSAEGGLATTNNAQLAEKMALYRSHGITREPEQLKQNTQETWYYEQQALGFNYRLTELQAALGLSQLNRLNEYVAKRHQLVTNYRNGLADLPISWQQVTDDNYPSYHLFIIRLTAQSPWSRKQVFDALRQAKIGVNVHYIPIHTQPYYQQLGFKEGDFVQAEQYYQACLSLPLYPQLTDEQQQYIINTIKALLTV